MANNNHKDQLNVRLMLLQESIWNNEDKIRRIMENQQLQETEISKLKKQIRQQTKSHESEE